MRRHKIDNDRTRRHMYRHANECRYYMHMVDRQDFIYAPEIATIIDEDLKERAEELRNKLEREMRYKYPKVKESPLIRVRFSNNEVDLDRDLMIFRVELTHIRQKDET